MGCDQSSNIKYRQSNRPMTVGNRRHYNINMSVFDEYGIDKDKNVILFICSRIGTGEHYYEYYDHYLSFIKPGTNTAYEFYRADISDDDHQIFNYKTTYLYTVQGECITKPSKETLTKFGIAFSPEKGYHAL